MDDDEDAIDNLFELLETETEVEKRRKYLREYTQKHKERDKEKNAARTRKWRVENIEKVREQGRRNRAKSLGEDLPKTRSKDRNKRLRKFGITIEDYHELLKNQGGGCAICGIEHNGQIGNKHKYNTSEDLDRDKLFSVDHDHRTNKVRGLLCTRCNNALGCFDDRIELLERSIEYLKKYRE